MADDNDRDVYAAWVEIDRARAVHPVDHEAIQSTEPLRSLVLSRLANLRTDRDLFTACARLGGMLADLGASPTLASGAIDGATQALERAGQRPKALDDTLIAAARASLIEGFAAAIRDAERVASSSAWEYPACVVAIGSDAVAIACGYPSDDPEAIALWAARLATKLVKAKTKRAVLSGSPIVMKEVESALSFVGVATGSPTAELGPEQQQPKKSWLPWRR
jgi:hypothetical protein